MDRYSLILEEKFLHLSSGVFRGSDGVTLDIGMLVDLPIISTHHGLVPKKVNSLEAFILDVSQTVCLIPAGGEDVKGDLAANGEGQSEVGEGLLELLYERLADLMHGIVLVKIIPLSLGAVPSDGGDVDHPITEFNKGSPLYWEIQIGDVSEGKVDELLVLVLAEESKEALGS